MLLEAVLVMYIVLSCCCPIRVLLSSDLATYAILTLAFVFLVFIYNGIPFIGFGFLDNALMIVAVSIYYILINSIQDQLNITFFSDSKSKQHQPMREYRPTDMTSWNNNAKL